MPDSLDRPGGYPSAAGIGQALIDRERAAGQEIRAESATTGEGAAKVRAPRRTRSRSSTFKIDKTVIAERVIKFFTDDNADRQFDIEARIQRYAKFRMWTEGKTDPWPGASDVGLPDIATAVLKLEDTLHNAVLQTRPITNAKAFKDTDRDKQQTVDNLLDYQFFVEGAGETKVGRMAHNYVMDGVMRVFVPWVKEERAAHDVRQFPEIPEGESPGTYLAKQIMTVYPAPMFQAAEMDPDGWRWRVAERNKDSFVVDFYTAKDGSIEMDAERVAEVFNGPCPIPLEYEEICKPARAENLQIPGPSNPRGAAHVVKVDYPSLDEVKRLIASGYYDLVEAKDKEAFGMAVQDSSEGQAMREQKDVLAGVQQRDEPTTLASSPDAIGKPIAINDHKTLTRLMCFDIFDIDGDGENEDVIWWVIKETKTLLRARELTQQFPSNPPRRPFAESHFLEEDISLPELMESMHDIQKQILDMQTDLGTMTLGPIGFYRSTSNIRNETIRYAPFEMYGLSNPQQDVYFPTFPQSNSNMGFNMLSMLNSLEERLVTQGDLQYGRVPQGKASALRTVRGMQSIMSQGESRPERILRRFFIGLCEMFAQMHELNQVFLPRDKQFRVFGVARPNDNPYRMIDDPAQKIGGRYTFDFRANTLNSARDALQAALTGLMQVFMTPIMVQFGIMTPDGAYNLGKDYAKALGQDPDRYITAPSPDSSLPRMNAWDVLSAIYAGNLPECRPLEDAREHMQIIMDFTGTPEFGNFTPAQVDTLKAYIKLMVRRVADEERQKALVAAAGASGMGAGGEGIPGPQPGPQAREGATQLGKGELADESLPGAGGGANQRGMMQ